VAVGIGFGLWTVAGVSQRMSADYQLPGQVYERELAFSDARFVHHLLQPGERALTAFSVDRYDLYYLGPDRRYVQGCILTLADFKAGLANSVLPRYYVIHLRQLPDQPPDPSLPTLVYSRCHDEPIEPALLDYLVTQGYSVRDEGVYRIVTLTTSQ